MVSVEKWLSAVSREASQRDLLLPDAEVIETTTTWTRDTGRAASRIVTAREVIGGPSWIATPSVAFVFWIIDDMSPQSFRELAELDFSTPPSIEQLQRSVEIMPRLQPVVACFESVEPSSSRVSALLDKMEDWLVKCISADDLRATATEIEVTQAERISEEKDWTWACD